jgi:hypothetical protein
MIDPTRVQFYVKTPSGVLGPFPSKFVADMAVLAQPADVQSQCIVEGKTDDGKNILLG